MSCPTWSGHQSESAVQSMIKVSSLPSYGEGLVSASAHGSMLGRHARHGASTGPGRTKCRLPAVVTLTSRGLCQVDHCGFVFMQMLKLPGKPELSPSSQLLLFACLGQLLHRNRKPGFEEFLVFKTATPVLCDFLAREQGELRQVIRGKGRELRLSSVFTSKFMASYLSNQARHRPSPLEPLNPLISPTILSHSYLSNQARHRPSPLEPLNTLISPTILSHSYLSNQARHRPSPLEPLNPLISPTILSHSETQAVSLEPLNPLISPTILSHSYLSNQVSHFSSPPRCQTPAHVTVPHSQPNQAAHSPASSRHHPCVISPAEKPIITANLPAISAPLRTAPHRTPTQAKCWAANRDLTIHHRVRHWPAYQSPTLITKTSRSVENIFYVSHTVNFLTVR
ncbi:hypothetical protein RRG08_020245 [Elysia crispata]|uniref:Uncharacterized protein n=1 Tax=Elysia crispata TaxID=231223 RepID=A0AAE1A2D8_9GAST|nr:hypothetical protein RRG08_020245 [Elysia crispata]